MEKFSKVKEKHLGARQHWYLWIVARHPERRNLVSILEIHDSKRYEI
jgi:hypothetical protein